MFFDATSFEPVEVLPGLTRRYLGHGKRILGVEFVIAPGVAIPAHSHPYEQAGYLVQGKGKMRIGDEWRDVQTGASYVIAEDVEHEFIAEEPTTVIDFFSPPREDYQP